MAQLVFRYADSENSRAFAARMKEISRCSVMTASQFIEGCEVDANTLIILDAHLLRRADVIAAERLVKENEITVIGCGQRADRTGEPFEGSKYFMAIADTIKNGSATDSVSEIFGKTAKDRDASFTEKPRVAVNAANKVENTSMNDEIPQVLISFLDASTSAEKIEIISLMQNSLNDDIINAMAASLDTQVREGELEERVYELRRILEVRKKYECTRLR